MTKRWMLAALVCLPTYAGAQGPPPIPAAPTIAFTARGATVSGVTPNAKVAWLMAARQFSDMSLRLVRQGDIVADEDGDRTVRIELDRVLPEQSVWVAVDLTSGAHAFASPAGFSARSVALPVSAVRPGGGRSGDALELASHQLELLLVRPNGGAWVGTFGDGGPADVDSKDDGGLRVGFDSLEPLGNAGQLGRVTTLQPGDVIVAVDSMSLDVYASRIGGGR